MNKYNYHGKYGPRANIRPEDVMKSMVPEQNTDNMM